MLKLLALSSSVLAVAIDSNSSSSFQFDSRPWVYLYSILSIAAGIFLMFFGLKLFRIMLFVVGFIFVYEISYTLIIFNEPIGGFFNQGYMIPVVVSVVLGILGGFLARSIWKVGISILGFMAGLQFVDIIWSLKEGGLIENSTVYLIILIVFGIAGAVAVHMIEKPSLIGGTSLIGSYMIISTLDSILSAEFLRGKHSPAGLLLVLAGTGLGVVCQYKTTKDLKYRDP
ncbi:hypothetical protein BC833DRAFT_599212 [Globomyces pollinis-pini]|nr:hypothetical protein BC833DRAFT_599212 [Globomyces pollinis-pini]